MKTPANAGFSVLSKRHLAQGAKIALWRPFEANAHFQDELRAALEAVLAQRLSRDAGSENQPSKLVMRVRIPPPAWGTAYIFELISSLRLNISLRICPIWA